MYNKIFKLPEFLQEPVLLLSSMKNKYDSLMENNTLIISTMYLNYKLFSLEKIKVIVWESTKKV